MLEPVQKLKVLTKSRFKLALECPNKIFYTGKTEYANAKNDDSFLAALAEGGFQVEELARMHYPDGIFIDTDHYEYLRAAELTKIALQKENVVIYEAAFLFDGLFIRTDILVKTGNHIKLIEVKAKSFDSSDPYLFVGKNGGIVSGWKPYLFDLAFQKYVVAKSHPEFRINAWLLMADKTKKAGINGLNQLFRIPKNGNPRTDIIKKVNSLAEIGKSVLSEADVDGIINDIISNIYIYADFKFEQAIELFRNAYQNDQFLNSQGNFSNCKNCEFKATYEDEAKGLKSGFKHCFSSMYHWKESDFSRPNAFEIWNYRGNAFNKENRLFLSDLTIDDFAVKPCAGKISSSERQWIQLEKSLGNDSSVFVLKEELFEQMQSWKYPLHFIDFETSAVALPFHAGRRPYEQIAFQFSHHQYNENGVIEHKSEFISTKAGEFPNFIFARALKQALGNDNGSIFRYAAHENTILNHIIKQLQESDEDDKMELIAYLKTITTSTSDNTMPWNGERSMIDLRRIVLDYYYNPLTKGSNSLKYLLPACLNSSQYLKAKYCNPIAEINLTSTNFDGSHVWLKMEGDTVKNPYKILPKLFQDWTDEQIDQNLGEIETIADGGAALMAYAKLQYQDMTELERSEIKSSLLKYCELDTLAMVMIYEHFRFDLLDI
jgi:hypothetical protein